MGTTITLYGLDGTPYDITGEAFDVSLSAGRNVELDTIDPGGGVIRLHNRSRNFDPFFATTPSYLLQADDASRVLQASGDGILLALPASSSGAYGAMVQGRKIVVKDGAVTVFTGFVEDFNYTWRRYGIADVELVVKDSLATLGRTTYLEHTRTENQLTGTRITEMLNRAEVGFPTGGAARSISTGLLPCQADTVSFGTNVLNDLQNIAKTEFGRLFVDRAGVLTFLDRYAVFGATPSAAFDDTGAELPFSAVDVRFGSELLYFTVSVQRAGGVVKTVTNSAAMAANPNLGARHLAMSGLLFSHDQYSKALATYLADRYSTAEAIVSSMTVPLKRLGTTDRATVCGLEIGDVITFDWTPTGAGGTVSQTLAIEGWSYQADHSTASTMSFQLSDARDVEFLIYDTDAYDSGKTYAF